jgi:hypothetical protein
LLQFVLLLPPLWLLRCEETSATPQRTTATSFFSSKWRKMNSFDPKTTYFVVDQFANAKITKNKDDFPRN